MTELEKDIVLSANQVRYCLTRIYEHRDREMLFWGIIKLEEVSNLQDYYKTLIDLNKSFKERINKNNSNAYFIESTEKEKYLSNFEEKNRELLSKYWDGTIGFANSELTKIFNNYLENLCKILVDLDKHFLKSCSISVEEFSKLLKSELTNKLPQKQINVSKVSDKDKDFMILTTNNVEGDLLKLAIEGKESVHFIGNSNAYINPYTAEQIVNQDLGYVNNLLQLVNDSPAVKDKILNAVNKILVSYLKENIHEVIFTKFVLLADALDDLRQGYLQVKKIFDVDLNKFLSNQMIRKQRRYLAIGKKDVEKMVDEIIKDYQKYVIDTYSDINKPFVSDAQRKILKTESPFPEFD